MDGEVRLPVVKVVVVVFADNNSNRNFLLVSICSRYATRDVDTCYLNTFGVLTDDIFLTAVVVGMVLLRLGKGQRGDISLIRLTQAAIRVCRDDSTHSVWRVAYLEWSVDNIYVACCLHVDCRIVTFLVRQTLELRS